MIMIIISLTILSWVIFGIYLLLGKLAFFITNYLCNLWEIKEGSKKEKVVFHMICFIIFMTIWIICDIFGIIQIQ